jgi:hypothetical protein
MATTTITTTSGNSGYVNLTSGLQTSSILVGSVFGGGYYGWILFGSVGIAKGVVIFTET